MAASLTLSAADISTKPRTRDDSSVYGLAPLDFGVSSMLATRQSASEPGEPKGPGLSLKNALEVRDFTGIDTSNTSRVVSEEPYPSPTIDSGSQERADAQQRVALLARQFVYGDQLDKEASARLLILQERVRKAFPRVIEQDFEELEDANREIAMRVNRAASLLSELGV